MSHLHQKGIMTGFVEQFYRLLSIYLYVNYKQSMVPLKKKIGILFCTCVLEKIYVCLKKKPEL